MTNRALVELALRDIDRFQRQKVKDLKDVFTNYAVLQTEKYKKVFLTNDFLPFSRLCFRNSLAPVCFKPKPLFIVEVMSFALSELDVTRLSGKSLLNDTCDHVSMYVVLVVVNQVLILCTCLFA